jgi:hypothetical protein
MKKNPDTRQIKELTARIKKVRGELAALERKLAKLTNWLDIPVQWERVPVRIATAFERIEGSDIEVPKTYRELIRFSPRQLNRMDKLGWKSIGALQRHLADLGLELKSDLKGKGH